MVVVVCPAHEHEARFRPPIREQLRRPQERLVAFQRVEADGPDQGLVLLDLPLGSHAGALAGMGRELLRVDPISDDAQSCLRDTDAAGIVSCGVGACNHEVGRATEPFVQTRGSTAATVRGNDPRVLPPEPPHHTWSRRQPADQQREQVRLDVEPVDDVGSPCTDPGAGARDEPRQIPATSNAGIERFARFAQALVERAFVTAEERRDGDPVPTRTEAGRESCQLAVDTSAENRTRHEDDGQKAATLTG